jgi:hypothetical protein
VVQREIVREIGGGGGGGGSGGASLSFRVLKRGEYLSWAMVMEVNL